MNIGFYLAFFDAKSGAFLYSRRLTSAKRVAWLERNAPRHGQTVETFIETEKAKAQ